VGVHLVVLRDLIERHAEAGGIGRQGVGVHPRAWYAAKWI
jgi:hypothetical protein